MQIAGYGRGMGDHRVHRLMIKGVTGQLIIKKFAKGAFHHSYYHKSHLRCCNYHLLLIIIHCTYSVDIITHQ